MLQNIWKNVVKASCLPEMYAVVQKCHVVSRDTGSNECHERFWSGVESPAVEHGPNDLKICKRPKSIAKPPRMSLLIPSTFISHLIMCSWKPKHGHVIQYYYGYILYISHHYRKWLGFTWLLSNLFLRRALLLT